MRAQVVRNDFLLTKVNEISAYCREHKPTQTLLQRDSGAAGFFSNVACDCL